MRPDVRQEDAVNRSLATHAHETADKPAVILGSGDVLSYGELDVAANRGAHVLRDAGLRAGDTVAMCLENSLPFFAVTWAALRCGLVLVPVSARLTASEVAFIVEDSGAKALLISSQVEADLEELAEQTPRILRFAVGAKTSGYRSWDEETGCASPLPIDDEAAGSEMLYSSGTTGRPKGIRHGSEVGGIAQSAARMFTMLGLGPDMVYLSPAPLYHSAPFGWSVAAIQLGGTVVVMERFDPELALALIERHKVTVSQWVPTHFVRLLKLPEARRGAYDLSSLEVAVHAAAPCPVPVKKAMIEWWGPRLAGVLRQYRANRLDADHLQGMA